MITVGIVGGLGTETSCSFCLNVNQKVHRLLKVQPNLLMDNVPMPLPTLQALAMGEPTEEVKSLLLDSISRLNKANPSFIVIPCNTVHVFIDDLRKHSSAPIISIIDETVRECKNRGFQRIGVLGSTTTTKFGLYTSALQKEGISPLQPTEQEQQFISEVILRILDAKQTDHDKRQFMEIISSLQKQGAEAIILGCTDLFLLIKSEDASLPLINSTEVLEGSVVEKLIQRGL